MHIEIYVPSVYRYVKLYVSLLLRNLNRLITPPVNIQTAMQFDKIHPDFPCRKVLPDHPNRIEFRGISNEDEQIAKWVHFTR